MSAAGESERPKRVAGCSLIGRSRSRAPARAPPSRGAASAANSASITSQGSVIAGLSGATASYTLQTAVATGSGTRYVTGIGLASGSGGLSQIVLMANDILVAALNGDGSINPVSPFEVVGGQVLMSKAVIGTITADQISANTTYTGNLSIGNGQLQLHGEDDGNGNGPYFVARDSNNVTRALIGRYGNDWGIWTWNGSGTNILSAGSVGVSAVGTGNLAAGAASSGAGAYTAATYAIPVFDTWEAVQVVAVSVPSNATGLKIGFSIYVADPGLYAGTTSIYEVSGGGGGGGNGGGA